MKIAFLGQDQDNDLMFISYQRAQRLMSRGLEVFLDSVIAMTGQKSPMLEEISIVCDFADVFPDVLSSLPPAREVEFAIAWFQI